MNRPLPLLVDETEAARLLSLRPSEFRRLVEAGSLPGPREIVPGLWRWVVEDLRQISTGGAVEVGVQW